MKQLLRPALLLFVLLSGITGLAYPLLVTGLGQVAFPRQASGSLVYENGRLVGSALIGQNFTEARYFWGRPSATAPQPYNGIASGGSNLGPLNPALTEGVKARKQALLAADPANPLAIPVELVTASGSGLDPHLSVAAATYQIDRVARARHLPPATVAVLVKAHTEGRQWGFLGEPRVNVLALNRALDRLPLQP